MTVSFCIVQQEAETCKTAATREHLPRNRFTCFGPRKAGSFSPSQIKMNFFFIRMKLFLIIHLCWFPLFSVLMAGEK